MMGRLTQKLKEELAQILFGISEGNAAKVSRALIHLSESDEYINAAKLENQLDHFLNEYTHQKLRQLDASQVLNDLFRLFYENQLKMPADLYLLLKTLVVIQANAKNLDPEFDMMKHLEPYVKKLIRQHFHPINFIQNLYFTASEFSALLRDLPQDAHEIIERIKKGKIKVDIEHKGLAPMLNSHERIVNRLVFAMVLASIIIGSSLIVLSKIPPFWNGIPIIGIIG